jgi:hypothetical protein
MTAVVLFHSPWKTVEELAGLIAADLGARALSFERRPELAMYDLVVLGTSGPGLLDPRLLPYLAAGTLRGKHLAIFSDIWPPLANEAFQVGARAAATVGGASPTAEWLQVSTGPFGQLTGADRAAAHAWARKLATEFPPAGYPRSRAGDQGRPSGW